MEAKIIKSESGYDLTLHLTDKEYAVLRIIAAVHEETEAECAVDIFCEIMRADIENIFDDVDYYHKFSKYLKVEPSSELKVVS